MVISCNNWCIRDDRVVRVQGVFAMSGCSYMNKRFSVPTSEKINQEEWNGIFKKNNRSEECSIIEHRKSLDSKELGEVNCG